MIGLDFETYAEVDLTKHGLDRYISCPHFTPLIAVVVWDSGVKELFDFVSDYTEAKTSLAEAIGNNLIVAHNAGFEQAVLASMGLDYPSNRFIDSAVLARAAGAAGKLEAAAPQLLGIDKVATGWELIKLFSIGTGPFDPAMKTTHAKEWAEFIHYCAVDAQLSLQIATRYPVSAKELANTAVTMDMNLIGWNVDVDLVLEMQARYLKNVDAAVDRVPSREVGAAGPQPQQQPQLIAWCKVRGVKASSFDEAHVERMLRAVAAKS